MGPDQDIVKYVEDDLIRVNQPYIRALKNACHLALEIGSGVGGQVVYDASDRIPRCIETTVLPKAPKVCAKSAREAGYFRVEGANGIAPLEDGHVRDEDPASFSPEQVA